MCLSRRSLANNRIDVILIAVVHFLIWKIIWTAAERRLAAAREHLSEYGAGPEEIHLGLSSSGPTEDHDE